MSAPSDTNTPHSMPSGRSGGSQGPRFEDRDLGSDSSPHSSLFWILDGPLYVSGPVALPPVLLDYSSTCVLGKFRHVWDNSSDAGGVPSRVGSASNPCSFLSSPPLCLLLLAPLPQSLHLECVRVCTHLCWCSPTGSQKKTAPHRQEWARASQYVRVSNFQTN